MADNTVVLRLDEDPDRYFIFAVKKSIIILCVLFIVTVQIALEYDSVVRKEGMKKNSGVAEDDTLDLQNLGEMLENVCSEGASISIDEEFATEDIRFGFPPSTYVNYETIIITLNVDKRGKKSFIEYMCCCQLDASGKIVCRIQNFY